jgi:AraC-like DNA-binding protein
MVQKHPVLIITSEEDESYYQNFPLPAEEIMLVPYGQAICSVLVREIDLVLLDSGFDPGFGLKLLADLKARFPRVPVLFVTDNSSKDIIVAAFKNGARDFFQKPLPVLKVRDVIMELLRAKRGVHEQRDVLRDNGSDQQAGHLCEIGELQPAVMKVVCQIEANYKEGFSLEQMAALANMSKYHFVRLFNREVGMSPVRYLKFVRIQRAKELLKRTELSVFSTAMRVGFGDVSNFNKNFRKFEGCTPVEYRSNLR